MTYPGKEAPPNNTLTIFLLAGDPHLDARTRRHDGVDLRRAPGPRYSSLPLRMRRRWALVSRLSADAFGNALWTPGRHASPTRGAYVSRRKTGARAQVRVTIALIAIQGLETIPEIAKRQDLLAQARVAMRARNFVLARSLCDQADRVASLARTRLASRREREAS